MDDKTYQNKNEIYNFCQLISKITIYPININEIDKLAKKVIGISKNSQFL